MDVQRPMVILLWCKLKKILGNTILQHPVTFLYLTSFPVSFHWIVNTGDILPTPKITSAFNAFLSTTKGLESYWCLFETRQHTWTQKVQQSWIASNCNHNISTKGCVMQQKNGNMAFPCGASHCHDFSNSYCGNTHFFKQYIHVSSTVMLSWCEL